MIGWVFAALTGVGLLLLGFGSSKAASATPPPPKPDDPPPVPEAKVREITVDTPTPWQFAVKYAGNGALWKELIASNPPGGPTPEITLHTWVLWQDTAGAWHYTAPPGYVPPDPSAPGGVRPSKSVTGLSPWAYGQKVTLPTSWPG